jgi:cytochrome c553
MGGRNAVGISGRNGIGIGGRNGSESAPGAIERGKALTHQGAQPCVSCHGADLKGKDKAPPLAGRDPHYLARALWDIKSGARSGPTVALMQKPVAGVTEDQIVDIVAYAASLAP